MNDILVVKVGGSANVDTAAILQDVAAISRERPVIVVHGVSQRMAQLSQARGIAEQMLQSPSGHSSRYTPPPVRDLFVEAATQINTEIVAALNRARGLLDPVVIHGERKTALRAIVDGRVRIIRDDYTGRITTVDHQSLWSTLERGQIAVIPPMASSQEGLLNIDGDRAAAAIAGAVRAQTLVILSNVRGLYRDFSADDSLIAHIAQHQIDTAMTYAQGRMKRKVLGAQAAIQAGVRRVTISDGRIHNPVSQALNGEGTTFTA